MSEWQSSIDIEPALLIFDVRKQDGATAEQALPEVLQAMILIFKARPEWKRMDAAIREHSDYAYADEELYVLVEEFTDLTASADPPMADYEMLMEGFYEWADANSVWVHSRVTSRLASTMSVEERVADRRRSLESRPALSSLEAKPAGVVLEPRRLVDIHGEPAFSASDDLPGSY